MKNKLKNQKIIVDGIKFDSRAEARRYGQLLLLLKAGEISDLKLQKVYELIPAQYEYIPTGKIFARGERKGQAEYKRVTIERPVLYIADFAYQTKNGKTVVEDVKGYRDTNSAPYAKFVLKRKLMLWRYGIRVKEVKG
ncbi:MAG: DUF1064 domain-containing protein [Clostridia bacterium]|nr:DUF1064 domain-containing protein [Clostridia bacterium]